MNMYNKSRNGRILGDGLDKRCERFGLLSSSVLFGVCDDLSSA